uniref:Uncharacterized protein n=1 Tax=Anguilla anguilla TaxID=7936 RepID=A0A0E9UZF1_ANGAN
MLHCPPALVNQCPKQLVKYL